VNGLGYVNLLNFILHDHKVQPACRWAGVQGTRHKVQGTRYRVQGTRYKVQGTGYRVQGAGCKLKLSDEKVIRHIRYFNIHIGYLL
jgi:hypothetical protein